MAELAACATCGSVGLLLQTEAALVAALICEVTLATASESEAGSMTAIGEEVDVGGIDEVKSDD